MLARAQFNAKKSVNIIPETQKEIEREIKSN
jgi:hypothetical protein